MLPTTMFPLKDPIWQPAWTWFFQTQWQIWPDPKRAMSSSPGYNVECSQTYYRIQISSISSHFSIVVHELAQQSHLINSLKINQSLGFPHNHWSKMLWAQHTASSINPKGKGNCRRVTKKKNPIHFIPHNEDFFLFLFLNQCYLRLWLLKYQTKQTQSCSL